MALLFSERFRADIGGHRFLAIEVTADGTNTDLTAASIGLTSIETAMIASKGNVEGSADYDIISLADGLGETATALTVTGAAYGDFMLCAASVDLVDMTVTPAMGASGVEIRIQNESTATHNLASATFRATVLKNIGLSTFSGTKITFWPALTNDDKFTVWIIGR